ncbi:MAG: MFS transporter [Vampirovibrionales bacterium]|nr:MFS transporter [Vampirovibrionales bacterium]
MATTLFYSASHLFTTMLPIHLDGIHVTPTESGKLLALFLVASVLVRPLVGKLYDEWSPRRLFLISMAFFGAGTVLMLLMPNTLWMLWVARALQGIGFSFFNSVSYSYLTETVPEQSRARGIAMFSNAIKFAMAYAPAIGWIMADKGWCIEAMLLSLAILLASLFVILRMGPLQTHRLQEEQAFESTVTASKPFAIKGRLFNVKGVTPGLLIATNSFVFGALIPFIPLIVASKGIQHVESFHIFYAFSLIASRFLGGESSDKFGRLYTIIPGMALVVVSLIGIYYSFGTVPLLISAVLYGLGAGVVQPSIVAMVADRTQVSERGSAMATYTMLADSGQGIGMMAMGYFGQHLSYDAGLLASIVTAIVGLIFAIGLSLQKKVKRPSVTSQSQHSKVA